MTCGRYRQTKRSGIAGVLGGVKVGTACVARASGNGGSDDAAGAAGDADGTDTGSGGDTKDADGGSV